MEPSKAIETGENALRSIVRELLSDRWQELIGEKALASTIERQTLEPKGRPGALETDDLLSYVDTPVLTSLILNRWSQFAPVFGNMKRTKECFNAFVVYRRRVAHNRPLLPFERDLLSGLSGQFRNQISIYRQSQSARVRPQFFARIDQAVDPEGREGLREYGYFNYDEYPILQVGDTLAFSLNATDPRGREIEWALVANDSHFVSYLPYDAAVPSGWPQVATGDAVRIEWTPQSSDFSAHVYVHIFARNSSGFYATSYGYDDAMTWAFAMEPPY